MARTMLIHATDLLRKGLIAAPGERWSPAGEPTNALYALVRAVLRALAMKTPNVALAVLDETAPNKPTLLQAQHEALAPLLRGFGFAVESAPNPMDVVATLTRQALDRGDDVVVVGSDKRLAQLVGPSVWWYDGYKDVRYTAELVRKRFDVGPEHVAGWLALTGDPDAMPGLKGIGRKGSTSLVEAFGSVEAAIERADEVPGRTGKVLRDQLEDAKREVERATLKTNVTTPWSSVPSYAPPSTEQLNSLFAELGFVELLQAAGEMRAGVTLCSDVEAATAAVEVLRTSTVSLAPVVEDPSAVRGALVGLAAVTEGGDAFYLSLKHRGTTATLDPWRSWLTDKECPKIAHDTKELAVALARQGIELAGIVGDASCASHLTEPSGLAPHELVPLARVRLHRPLPSEDDIRGVGGNRKRYAALGAERVGNHAAELARAAGDLWRHFEPGVTRELLSEYLELSDTVGRMEMHGLLVDDGDLAEVGEDFDQIGRDLEAEIFDLAGKTFNVASTKQLGDILYDELKLPVTKRTKTGYSVANDALERIEHAHPIVPLVIRHRTLGRLRSTWVTALRRAIAEDGRVRSTMSIARSFSGRIVNANPDLGRVPKKTPEMLRIRHAFRAPEGHVLMSVDYQQLGLYVLAHLTEDPALVEPLSRKTDMHTATAAAVLDISPSEVKPHERQLGKVINFATFAGQGASALALQLGVDAQQAKDYIARFDAHYSRVRAFQDTQLERVRREGFIVTIAGRHWPIGGLDALDTMMRSYAERLARRATHEGSVADVSRRGLLRADQALRKAGLRTQALLQVHDEVLFEVPEDELADAARCTMDAMRTAFDLVVPLRVSCRVGTNWAELEDYP